MRVLLGILALAAVIGGLALIGHHSAPSAPIPTQVTHQVPSLIPPVGPAWVDSPGTGKIGVLA